MIRVQEAPFDSGEEIAALNAEGETGAIASFTGLVRAGGDREDVTALFLEHYPGMTEQVIEGLVQQARGRWSIQAVRIVHRVGTLPLGDPIVFVGVASAHRHDAFAACEFLMDALKTDAPFWKKEITRDGSSQWVEQKESDRTRADRWSQEPAR
ncbi:molybdenum cofactor biosynthesis protein MoaE [Tamilnaduibacter salinus]|uniref:Molybdopterin synthase catalytic subunit n=1 Tax=Tamilnaduibacter salinus TaxID=1484056 RepID=A0A2A2I263_9GAMM|nr:molybdopterin synthase catalytic subunit MoaE [Tamilnaduibacter salinus]PAV25406.1 molybdenum cofactor biosynthesis protein MoaE [Tamilnaduibacter salinus]